MLGKIRSECSKKLGDLQSKKENIFLISCHVREKWEFSLLRQANLYALEQNQRDAMIRLLEKASKEVLEEKVKVIGGDIWKTSAWSGAAALVPVASMVVDDWLIKEEFKRYKTELGIPEEESDEFKKLDPTSKAKVSVALNLLTKILPNSLGTSLTAALSSEVGIKHLLELDRCVCRGTSRQHSRTIVVQHLYERFSIYDRKFQNVKLC